MPKITSYPERARLRLSRDGAFYRRFVAGFKHSGLTLSAYCRKHQVGESTFRKYHPASGRGPAAVAPRQSRRRLSSPSLLVPLRSAEETRSVSHAAEVRLPEGIVLLLPRWDAAAAEALRVLLGKAP